MISHNEDLRQELANRLTEDEYSAIADYEYQMGHSGGYKQAVQEIVQSLEEESAKYFLIDQEDMAREIKRLARKVQSIFTGVKCYLNKSN